ncbi:MAG: SDR family oxidoreductase [Angustibacter sp.]
MPTPVVSRDLAGRVAVVTGGGSGLGRAICGELAAAGAQVLVADIDLDAAKQTTAIVDETVTGHGGGRAVAVELDVTDSAAVERFFDSASAEHGRALDLLVNNAGTDRGADVPAVSDDQWHQVFAVNAHGPLYTCRAFVRGLLDGLLDRTPATPAPTTPTPAIPAPAASTTAGSSGAPERVADIVNVVSISALTVGGGAGAYNSSKAALLKLTEVLQTEAREQQWPVRVCALNPAAMATPMMDQWGLPAERMMDPAVVAGLVRTAVTLPPQVVLQSAVITTRLETYPR